MTETPAPGHAPGSAAHVISQVYYYLAAVIGFGLFLGGAIGALFGVRELVLPREFETVRDGVRTVLHGLAFALPGLALMWWHLRQARRREDRPATTVFWGRALYFHLMTLVALIFVLIGGVGLLFNLGDAATARCDRTPGAHGIRAIPHDGKLEGDPYTDIETIPPSALPEGEFCYPSRDDAFRNAVDSSIFLIVAGPVFWWHLRQGRRLTAPPRDVEI